MRKFISIVTFIILAACNDSDTKLIKGGQTKRSALDTTVITKNTVPADTSTIPKLTQTDLTVLVLPPYDAIANEGISPEIQNYIESVFITDTTFRLIKFPYSRLMGVSYQNIFDKKYCSPIIDKVKTDFIIMSKLEQATGTGNMTTDKWDFKIKIYNTRTGNQIVSKLAADNFTSVEIESLIRSKRQELFKEIKNNR